MQPLNPVRRSPPRAKRLDKPVVQDIPQDAAHDTAHSVDQNMVQVLLDLSHANHTQGQSSQAIELLYQALEVAKSVKATTFQIHIHDLLYRAHKSSGATTAALGHLEQRISLQHYMAEHRHYEQMISGLTRELGAARATAEGYRIQIRGMEQTVLERAQALESAQIETLERLATAGERHEAYAPGHTGRVGDLAGRIAAAMGHDLHFTGQIRLAARLHDIGKIAISDHILQKPGKLTEEEVHKVQLHTLIGAEILAGSPSELMQMAEEIALCHHERWDGSGYPNNRAEEDIPLAARIVTVADAFDVMTHLRPYKHCWPERQAIEELRRAAGTHFDHLIVDALIRLFN